LRHGKRTKGDGERKSTSFPALNRSRHGDVDPSSEERLPDVTFHDSKARYRAFLVFTLFEEA
jgi:hypothetical protein